VFERGPYVSFANCGLPYYVGNVIQEENKLLVASAQLFKDRFNIEVRTGHEVTYIDRKLHEIEVKHLETGEIYREKYDALVLSPGANPIRPPLAGIDLPGIFSLRTIPDSRLIRAWIAKHKVEHAVIIGGGFVGLEMAENLAELGISVTVVEMLDQVLPPLDPEMAKVVQDHLVSHGVSVRLSDAVAEFEPASNGGLIIRTKSGEQFSADLVILSIGVRPETMLARNAGLTIGERGGIRVDEQMRTSDPNIWAVGDAVETRNFVTGEWGLVPLAGPANRQGRVAADSICGKNVAFRGVQGTAVCGLFGLTVASTGANEKTLRRLGTIGYQKIYLHPGQHVSYYPGASPIHMKLLFANEDGRILGAQAVGREGVEKRIDVLAMAIQEGASVHDLEEAELCYAPQYGAAKDPVNMAGMIAANVLRGDVSLAAWEELPDTRSLVVDVRQPEEFAAGHIAGAINLPLPELRSRLQELPREQEIWVHCGVGQRSYYAARILRQKGFTVRNLSGGFTTYRHFGTRLEASLGVSSS
jgi:NADPH-dependent 2,4-dienoyl-CoA reductase/sulfur reductase-like enzyme/rhodanese-related sulfurtransferase